MQKKPIYRKLNEVGTYGHLEPLTKYRFDRHKKTPVGNKMRTKHKEFRYDYAPLFRFLLSKVGQPWEPIFQECQSRLNDIKPLMRMVVNVNERGLVVDRNPDGNMEKYCFMGEMSAWSTLYVDEVGLLQFVDKDYVKTDENPYPEQTFTFNGIPVNSEYVEMRGN